MKRIQLFFVQYLTVWLFPLLLTGCKEEQEAGSDRGIFVPSYVLAYEEVEEVRMMSLRHLDGTCVLLCGYIPGTAYAFNSTDSTALARYKELCRQAGDTAYNREITRDAWDFFDNRCYPVNGWEEIDLTCDKDYDAQHPAGSSLSDIVQFGSISPKRHIESGYQDWCNESGRDEEKISYYFFPNFWDGFQVDGRLDEGPYRGTNLLGKNNDNPLHFVLHLKKNPAVGGEYRFLLTCTDTEGKVFTATKTVQFPIE